MGVAELFGSARQVSGDGGGLCNHKERRIGNILRGEIIIFPWGRGQDLRCQRPKEGNRLCKKRLGVQVGLHSCIYTPIGHDANGNLSGDQHDKNTKWNNENQQAPIAASVLILVHGAPAVSF